MSGGGKFSQDCHFFLSSFCSKGDVCNFRHCPQAKLTDAVCYYWQNSNCTRYMCPYRHSEVASSTGLPTVYSAPTTTTPVAPKVGEVTEKKVNKQCFWDKQPSGCTRRFCSYLHFSSSQHKDDSKVNSHDAQEVRTSTGQLISSGSIILNREKLHSLKDIIQISPESLGSENSAPRRVVVPPAAGLLARREITGGIKSRLGTAGPGGQLKDRLGSKGDDLSILSDESREMSPDLEIIEELRSNALRSIDLRNRIENKMTAHRVSTSESPEILEYDSDIDYKRSKKKAKKEKKEKSKKKKHKKSDKLEKEEKLKTVADLPSASDYSDLDTPAGSPDPTAITVMSRTAGMYADTKAISKSAKIRLGKRKANEELLIDLEADKRKIIIAKLGDKISDDKLDLTKPRRGSLDASFDRNPSPPHPTSTSKRPPSISPPPVASDSSPSPTPQEEEEQEERRIRRLYSRSPSPPPPPAGSHGARSRSLSPVSSAKKVKLSEEVLKALQLPEFLHKKKKVKAKKNKKEKEEKKVTKKVKEEKRLKEEKKKKKLKKRKSKSVSSPSPSPPPSHSVKKIKTTTSKKQKKTKSKGEGKDLTAGKKSGARSVSPLLDDPELERQMREFLGE